jgi:hypothetical protein
MMVTFEDSLDKMKATVVTFEESLDKMEGADLVADTKAIEASWSGRNSVLKRRTWMLSGHWKIDTWINAWLHGATDG